MGDFIEEEQLIAKETIMNCRNQLGLSVHSQASERNDQQAGSLLQLLQCGICFSVLTPFKHPLQCSTCRNHLFCRSCTQKLPNGKCSYCN